MQVTHVKCLSDHDGTQGYELTTDNGKTYYDAVSAEGEHIVQNDRFEVISAVRLRQMVVDAVNAHRAAGKVPAAPAGASSPGLDL